MCSIAAFEHFDCEDCEQAPTRKIKKRSYQRRFRSSPHKRARCVVAQMSSGHDDEKLEFARQAMATPLNDRDSISLGNDLLEALDWQRNLSSEEIIAERERLITSIEQLGERYGVTAT